MKKSLTAALWVGVAACQGPGGHAVLGSVRVSRALVPGSTSTSSAVLFVTIENRGDSARRLVGARSPEADSVLFLGLFGERLDGIDLPAGARVRLAPGGSRAQLEGLRRPLAKGDTVTVELALGPGDHISVRAPVLPEIPASPAAAEVVNGNAFVWWCAHLVGVDEGDEGMTPATMQAMIVGTLVLLAVPVLVGISVLVWVLRRRGKEARAAP